MNTIKINNMYAILRAVLKEGDRIGVTKCPGTKRVITFSHWDGYWIVSKSGINDNSPKSVYSINGVTVNESILLSMYPDYKLKPFNLKCKGCDNIVFYNNIFVKEGTEEVYFYFDTHYCSECTDKTKIELIENNNQDDLPF